MLFYMYIYYIHKGLVSREENWGILVKMHKLGLIHERHTYIHQRMRKDKLTKKCFPDVSNKSWYSREWTIPCFYPLSPKSKLHCSKTIVCGMTHNYHWNAHHFCGKFLLGFLICCCKSSLQGYVIERELRSYSKN